MNFEMNATRSFMLNLCQEQADNKLYSSFETASRFNRLVSLIWQSWSCSLHNINEGASIVCAATAVLCLLFICNERCLYKDARFGRHN